MADWVSLLGSLPGYSAYYIVLVLASLLIPTAVRGLRISYARAIPWVLGASIFLAAFSISTGFYNGLTGEPYAMPRYLSVLLAGHNPYTYPLTFSYTQVQFLRPPLTLQSSGTYIYLPLLMFLYVPLAGAIGYEALAVAVWAGTVYLLRGDRWSVLVFGSPSIALIAANGFNDFLPIFLVTAALAQTGPPRLRSAAKYVSLGTKQFAPAALALYYFARRQWIQIGVVVAVTLLLLAPFLVWGGLVRVACSVSCSEFQWGATSFFSHVNYYIWPIWAVALFGPRLYRWSRSHEGSPFYWRARTRVERRIDPSWRRLSQCAALCLGYMIGWKASFRPPSTDVPTQGREVGKGPDDGNPFEDVSPARSASPGRRAPSKG